MKVRYEWEPSDIIPGYFMLLDDNSPNPNVFMIIKQGDQFGLLRLQTYKVDNFVDAEQMCDGLNGCIAGYVPVGATIEIYEQ